MKKWEECGWKRSWPTFFADFPFSPSIRGWLSGSWTI
jgi:hypothetical protein